MNVFWSFDRERVREYYIGLFQDCFVSEFNQDYYIGAPCFKSTRPINGDTYCRHLMNEIRMWL